MYVNSLCLHLTVLHYVCVCNMWHSLCPRQISRGTNKVILILKVAPNLLFNKTCPVVFILCGSTDKPQSFLDCLLLHSLWQQSRYDHINLLDVILSDISDLDVIGCVSTSFKKL